MKGFGGKRGKGGMMQLYSQKPKEIDSKIDKLS